MKKIIIFLMVFFALLSCDLQIPEYTNEELTVFEYLLADNIDDLHKNVTENIEYMNDIEVWNKYEYFQSPLQTATIKTGDCEDTGILFMFLLKEYLNLDSEMIIIKYFYTKHAIINILNDDLIPVEKNTTNRYFPNETGYFYDTLDNYTYPSISSSNITNIFKYDELLYYTNKYHNMPVFLK